MKVYISSQKEIFFRIIVPFMISVCALLCSIAIVYFYPGHYIFSAFVGLICLYVIYNTLLTGSYPDKVIVDDDFIVFYSLGKSQKYNYKDIKSFKVRESRYSKDMFIRINKPLFNKGRFWFNADSFNDGKELYRFIVELEYKIHPASLKSIARTGVNKDEVKRSV